MPMPQTASEAVAWWNSKQPLDAVRIGATPADQRRPWAAVFDILAKFPPASHACEHVVRGRTADMVIPEGAASYSYAQFEAWCYRNQVGYPPILFKKPPAGTPPQAPAPAEAAEFEAVRGMAFAILREGFAVVIGRRRAKAPVSAIVIRKA